MPLCSHGSGSVACQQCHAATLQAEQAALATLAAMTHTGHPQPRLPHPRHTLGNLHAQLLGALELSDPAAPVVRIPRSWLVHWIELCSLLQQTLNTSE